MQMLRPSMSLPPAWRWSCRLVAKSVILEITQVSIGGSFKTIRQSYITQVCIGIWNHKSWVLKRNLSNAFVCVCLSPLISVILVYQKELSVAWYLLILLDYVVVRHSYFDLDCTLDRPLSQQRNNLHVSWFDILCTRYSNRRGSEADPHIATCTGWCGKGLWSFQRGSEWCLSRRMGSETAELSFTCTTITCQLWQGFGLVTFGFHFLWQGMLETSVHCLSLHVVLSIWRILLRALIHFSVLERQSSLPMIIRNIMFTLVRIDAVFNALLIGTNMLSVSSSDHLVVRSSWESACTRKRRSNLAVEAYWKHLKAIFHILLIICSWYFHLAVNDFFLSGWSGDEWEFRARS